MEGMQYFYELFEAIPRGGPGDNKFTRQAFNTLTKLQEPPLILDIGCGCGVQTIELAKLSNGRIISLDNHLYFVATQGHPELKSKLEKPAPLFLGLAKAAIEKKYSKEWFISYNFIIFLW